MIVDDPETHAEVMALFEAYERALVSNDVEARPHDQMQSRSAADSGAAARAL